jgi:hypothetical protein
MNLRRSILLAVPLVAIGIGAGIAVSSNMPARFESTQEVFVSPLPAAQLAGADVYREWNTRDPESVMDREVSFANAVVRGLSIGANEDTSVTRTGQTGVMTVTSRATTAERSLMIGEETVTSYITARRAEFANSITAASAAIQSQIDELNKQIAGVTDAGYWIADNERNRLLDRRSALAGHKSQLDAAFTALQADSGATVLAVSAPRQVWPNPQRAGAIGGIIGANLALAIGLLLGRNRRGDNRDAHRPSQRRALPPPPPGQYVDPSHARTPVHTGG